jgi:ring-1,2-phenylacetyl-CoA epoxidase subunit PaaD
MQQPMQNLNRELIYSWLEQIADPEIPVLSILDLGIVRDVQVTNESVDVVITPTYSGCPAMDAIAFEIRMKLLEHGIKNLNLSQSLSPAWTTDWMTVAGKVKLRAYGIAPPQRMTSNQSMRLQGLLEDDPVVPCPQCQSADTREISRFGSTACKALYQCNDCKEPFDYFKCH